MAYDSLRGALFRNADKDKPTDRDYSGELNIEGIEYWVSGWINTSKKGDKYLALSLKPKDAPSNDTGPKPRLVDEMSDEIPF